MTIKRREFLTGLAAASWTGSGGGRSEEYKRSGALGSLESTGLVRLGLIGYGSRGAELVSLLLQAGLNIEFRGISDVYDLRMDRGISAAGSGTRGYKNYLDLLDAEDIDAVIVATPDHWHARMAMEAARRGKHIYLEKCMACSAEEAVGLREAVKSSGVVFQLGHQGRQRDLNIKARELLARDTLGGITLVESTTNRNDPEEGWKKPAGERASKESIDWELFQGPSPERHPFSRDRYYGWRNYWAYGTGMSGDLLTHEFDMVNSILDLGIPESAVASGGLYGHVDGREVPDVFQAAFEFPERSLTFLYSGTLANGIPRGTLFMGRDASLELGRILSVWADKNSIKYKSRIEAGMMDPSAPFVNYMKDQDRVDALTSATSKYYADRGLVETYREGRQQNTTGLHLAEWLTCIENGRLPSCNIDRGFEEAVTAHMATTSFREGRRVRWDPANETII